MKTLLAMGAAAMVGVGATAAGCGGGDGTTGFKQNTGGAGGGVISSGSHHQQAGGGTPGAGGNGPGSGGSSASNAGGGTSMSTGSSASSSTSSSSGGGSCGVFPQDNWWNTNIASADVDGNSSGYINFINNHGGTGPLHADFDSGGDGIPYQFVDNSVSKVAVSFTYADESDAGPYPIPANPLIEGGGDHHILMVDTSECKLYELWAAKKTNGGWQAGSGAIFDLTSDNLRPDCWTSADAAGLPVYPGLVRYSEVMAGAINHALRFTVDTSQAAWIKPARHWASNETSTNAPPMGLRFRLKSNGHVNGIVSGANAQPKVVLTALQQFGMLLADNGSNWYVSGEPNANWDDDGFHAAFDQLGGDDFEVIKPSDAIELPASCP